MKQPHKWDRDGERCVYCGDKDWMGGECNRSNITPHATEARLIAMGEPKSSRIYLADHPEHIPAVAMVVRPLNLPADETGD